MSQKAQILVAIITSGAFSAIVSAILNKVKKNNGVELGVQMLLYSDIKQACEKFINIGHVSSDDLEILLKKHKVYHDSLNGNGYLDTLINKIKQLPIDNS